MRKSLITPFTSSPLLPLNQSALILLNSILLCTMLWHIPNIPLWPILVGCLLCIWRFFFDLNAIPLPGKTIKILIALGAFIAIISTFRGFLGRDPGIAALIIFSALKLLELKTSRDFMIIVFLIFFLIMGNFLFDQSMLFFMVMIALIFVIFLAVLKLNTLSKSKSLKVSPFKFQLLLFLIALPLFICLFFFYPRSNGYFFRFSKDQAEKGISGFRSSITMGDIAQIAQSDEIAFRVQFENDQIPAYSNLYFRGAVLWFTNGIQWNQGNFGSSYQIQPANLDSLLKQEILLEPSQENWLFCLDIPIYVDHWARKYPGNSFFSITSISKKTSYLAYSSLTPLPINDITAAEKEWALQLPPFIHPQVEDLVSQWNTESSNTEQIISQAQNFYIQEKFSYTLNPGKLDPTDPVRDFLFNTKTGFCEHYATSFALLMRLAGIPSRVIAGYHGGTVNSIGHHLVVHQRNAHAWVEVWLDTSGWTRIDPTAWVAPHRIYAQDFNVQEADVFIRNQNQSNRQNQTFSWKFSFQKAYIKLADLWETIEIKWSYWIISYDWYRQWQFLKSLGFGKNRLLFSSLIVIVPILFFLIGLHLILKRINKPHNKVAQLYKVFLRKLQKHGFYYSIWEGPIDLLHRSLHIFPKRKDQLTSIFQLYIDLRYGLNDSVSYKFKFDQLKKAIRNFLPGDTHG